MAHPRSRTDRHPDLASARGGHCQALRLSSHEVLREASTDSNRSSITRVVLRNAWPSTRRDASAFALGSRAILDEAHHRGQFRLEHGNLFALLFELAILSLQLVQQHRAEELIAHRERFARL